MSRKKLPKKFQGADVVRGQGMHYKKFDDLVEKKAVDQFDATKEMYLVVTDDALGGSHGDVRGFADEASALRVARAMSFGNVDHRVLRITRQTLVVATENDL